MTVQPEDGWSNGRVERVKICNGVVATHPNQRARHKDGFDQRVLFLRVCESSEEKHHPAKRKEGDDSILISVGGDVIVYEQYGDFDAQHVNDRDGEEIQRPREQRSFEYVKISK